MEIIRFIKDSDILVITPLLDGHKISKTTKKTILRNDIDFSWISYTGNNNISKNVDLGLKEYLDKYPDNKVKYILQIDNDIETKRNMISQMYLTISKSGDDIAYCYVPFEYKGYINIKIKVTDFDKNKLLAGNYISSNSMIKLDKLLEVDGFITKFDRFGDWALWLHFLNNGYKGIFCKSTSFIAHTTPKSLSSNIDKNAIEIYKKIIEEFI